MASLEIIFDFKPAIEKAIRGCLISDIGSLWDDYCYDNNVPPEIKLHGINFLEQFAEQLNSE